RRQLTADAVERGRDTAFIAHFRLRGGEERIKRFLDAADLVAVVASVAVERRERAADDFLGAGGVLRRGRVESCDESRALFGGQRVPRHAALRLLGEAASLRVQLLERRRGEQRLHFLSAFGQRVTRRAAERGEQAAAFSDQIRLDGKRV